jgi:hypothetical protein
MPNRTPTNAKTTRCKATGGAQQCVSATHGAHQNHRWGKRGETDQWNIDGSPKIPDPADVTDQIPTGPGIDEFGSTPEGGYVDVPESPMDAAAMQTPATPDPSVGGYFNGDNVGSDEAAREEQRADVADQRRAAIAAAVTDDDRKDMERIGASHPDIQRDGETADRSLVRPDAGESVLAALGGVYNPAAEPGYAIRLAEDFARLMVMGPHFARLVQANADKQPPDPKDVRALYRKLRQIAATHSIDLDGGS